MDKLRRQFADPPLDLRGAPFWSWNDRLEPTELARQARDMKAHGMGGFFMHSRDGLETVYMGPEWMECVRETVRIAREEGLGAWLYDEDRWPSGAAGGLVPAAGGDAYRAKVITLEVMSDLPTEMDDVLAIFAGCVDGDGLTAARRVSLASPKALGNGEVWLVFRREVSGPTEWFNNDAYADNLNPEAVACFIATTYERYAQEIGEDFGGAVPGIFTDEPNVYAPNVRSGRRSLPWTDALPEVFDQRREYDLLDVVPWLFFEGDQTAKARHDYWYTISERFTEAFSQQLGDWCENHGLAFTGHYLCENEMGLAILRGGAVMPHYRHQHVPGIDMLCEQNHEFMTIKQCSSVASQFGRQRVLSELYGCSSWEFTFEGQKWVGDWQYVLGVNLRCQHLALYTIRGCRKRDYPPVFNYNTTWWKYNKVVEDYFARVGLLLTQGQAVRDVLVVHPVATGWTMLGDSPASMARTNTYGEGVNDFAQAVLAAHYDFDFGDEQILSAEASICCDEVQVGRARYRVVVIPPATKTLLASTVDLLEKFVAQGGQVIAFEPLPTLIEGAEDGRLGQALRQAGVTVLSHVGLLQAALEGAAPRRIGLCDRLGRQAAALLYMQRDLGDKTAFFIVNGDRDQGDDIDVTIEGDGQIEEWDALTGAIKPIRARSAAGQLSFRAHFGPAGSRLYVVDRQAVGDPSPLPEIDLDFRAGRRITDASFIGPSCTFSRTDPNVLTLDMCRYRMSDGCWSEPMEVWRAQSAIRESLDMRQNYYNGLPQRYKWALAPHASDGTPIELEFSFTVCASPPGPVYLLIEGASQFSLSLDGQPFGNEPTGWHLDRSFHKVLLPQLAVGDHWLSVCCGYTNHMELEDCFLIGDFGVNTDREIVAEPERLHFGDWTSQGYLHYAGSMIYHGTLDYDPIDGEHVRLYLGAYEAVDIAIHVNGSLAGHIPWRSENGLDLTPYLARGLNNVDIEVVSSPRNMLGPLHLATGREAWTDWRSFRRTDETYTPDYVVKAWGLIDQVRLQRGH